MKKPNLIIVVTPNYSSFLGDTILQLLRPGTKLPLTTIDKSSLLDGHLGTVTKTVGENGAQGTDRVQDRMRNK